MERKAQVFSLFDPSSRTLQELLARKVDRLLWAFIDQWEHGQYIVFDAVLVGGDPIPKPHLDAMRVTIVDRKRRWRLPIGSPAKFGMDADGFFHLRGRTLRVDSLPLLSRDAIITLTAGERDLTPCSNWHDLRREMERLQKG